MNRRILTAAMAMCLTVFAVPPVPAAASGIFHHNATDKATKAKVSFHVRNDTKTALTLSTGAQQITVQPGRVVSLKLEEGTQVTYVNGTDHIVPGAVLTTVTKELEGNTLAIA